MDIEVCSELIRSASLQRHPARAVYSRLLIELGVCVAPWGRLLVALRLQHHHTPHLASTGTWGHQRAMAMRNVLSLDMGVIDSNGRTACNGFVTDTQGQFEGVPILICPAPFARGLVWSRAHLPRNHDTPLPVRGARGRRPSSMAPAWRRSTRRGCGERQV